MRRRRLLRGLFLFAVLGAVLACAAAAFSASEAARDDIPGLSSTDQTAGMPASAIDSKAIPLGTGESSSSPQAGALMRCGGTPSGGPPVTTPPWVNTSAKTWDATTKVAVSGDVAFDSSFTAVHSGSSLVLSGNGLPKHAGTFPVATSDPAHAYNPNPGSITAHTIKLTLPYDPTEAASATCEGAIVGIASDGIPILDGFDAGGNDAAAVEVQDECHGHPNDVVGYHYHALSPCQLTASALTQTTQVGWALDGFGIYVEYDSQGRLLTNSALDGCHGRTSVVPWHGENVSIYHYDATIEFPYTVGCFRGTPVSSSGLMTSAAGGTGQSGSGGQQGGGSGKQAGGGSGTQAGGGSAKKTGGSTAKSKGGSTAKSKGGSTPKKKGGSTAKQGSGSANQGGGSGKQQPPGSGQGPPSGGSGPPSGGSGPPSGPGQGQPPGGSGPPPGGAKP